MTIRIINQDSVLTEARAVLAGAEREILITSPWIRQQSANALLRGVLPQIEAGALRARIVYRVKEPSDLEITDLEGIQALEEAGCEVRFSSRLHAKILVVDHSAALVSSSNITATAGYGDLPGEWRNEELGVLIENDPAALVELESEFAAIWDAASHLDEDTLGVAMDFPTVGEFDFVAIRPVKRGAFVKSTDLDGRVVIGVVSDIKAYNRSFPRMAEGAEDGTGRAPGRILDLQTLFSHASKDHGYLVTKTFHEPASAFQICRVDVLKAVERDSPIGAVVPVAPGSDVRRVEPPLLLGLIGGGDLAIGTTLHHEDVSVQIKSTEVLSKHLAVLGMTGSGKSNALKVVIQRLLADTNHADLRIVVVDTHGEYTPIADQLSSRWRPVRVELHRSILDEDVVQGLMRTSRKDGGFHQDLVWEAHDLGEEATLEQFVRDLAAASDDKRNRLASAAEAVDDLCLWEHETARIVGADGTIETFDSPGLYILDLRSSESLERRGLRAAAVMRKIFERGKASVGDFPAVIVVDEAQNFAPEQQTGWLSRARQSFDALFQVASEGRKFGIGLVVSTQRPARVNKDVLSQCNTHMIFRVANLEDLAAIAGSFEAASQSLIAELPGFDTGTCVIGGTAIDMVTRVRLPLFGDAHE